MPMADARAVPGSWAVQPFALITFINARESWESQWLPPLNQVGACAPVAGTRPLSVSVAQVRIRVIMISNKVEPVIGSF